MMWSLPIAVEINGTKHNIRNKCDYRVVLDVMEILNDDELSNEEKIKCALFVFYEDISQVSDIEVAINEMMNVLNMGEKEEEESHPKPRLMDWKHDFSQISPPINRVLGYSVRDENNYTHWYDFVGAYMEIGGDCTFSKIIAIRSKRAKGKKLDEWEEEFYRENRKLVDLPKQLTEEEKEWLDSDW